jgi:hypothetical protein
MPFYTAITTARPTAGNGLSTAGNPAIRFTSPSGAKLKTRARSSPCSSPRRACSRRSTVAGPTRLTATFHTASFLEDRGEYYHFYDAVWQAIQVNTIDPGLTRFKSPVPPLPGSPSTSLASAHGSRPSALAMLLTLRRSGGRWPADTCRLVLAASVARNSRQTWGYPQICAAASLLQCAANNAARSDT